MTKIIIGSILSYNYNFAPGRVFGLIADIYDGWLQKFMARSRPVYKLKLKPCYPESSSI